MQCLEATMSALRSLTYMVTYLCGANLVFVKHVWSFPQANPITNKHTQPPHKHSPCATYANSIVQIHDATLVYARTDMHTVYTWMSTSANKYLYMKADIFMHLTR